MEEKEAFLSELSELSKKYGMFIEGCGCCGSPYVYDENDGVLIENLQWDEYIEGYSSP